MSLLLVPPSKGRLSSSHTRSLFLLLSSPTSLSLPLQSNLPRPPSLEEFVAYCQARKDSPEPAAVRLEQFMRPARDRGGAAAAGAGAGSHSENGSGSGRAGHSFITVQKLSPEYRLQQQEEALAKRQASLQASESSISAKSVSASSSPPAAAPVQKQAAPEAETGAAVWFSWMPIKRGNADESRLAHLKKKLAEVEETLGYGYPAQAQGQGEGQGQRLASTATDRGPARA